jgi:hypothetical protein
MRFEDLTEDGLAGALFSNKTADKSLHIDAHPSNISFFLNLSAHNEMYRNQQCFIHGVFGKTGQKTVKA